MNIALILSTLVIGASMSNSPDASEQLQLQIAPPTSDLPLPPLQDNSATKQNKANRNSQRNVQDRAQRMQSRIPRSSAMGPYQQADNQSMQPMMPLPPTDSSGSQMGQSYQWLPPTANSSSADSASSGGRPSGMLGPMNAPTRARPGMSQSYTSMQNAEQQNRRMEAARNSAAAPPPQTSKPFSGLNQPSSSSSPYMNLFRSGNSNGTIDNYTTLVKPELDQRRTNQQFGADIHGLENSTHVQGLSIRQLNRDTQSLQGVNATQYFMNYGDYYQGAR